MSPQPFPSQTAALALEPAWRPYQQPVNRTLLDNGMRILVSELPHTHSITLLVFVGVGARYEDSTELNGISHFVEHMFFKGTTRRPTARQISAAIEGRGGGLNASTGHELTSYYVRVAYQHFPIALDVLSDMLRGSLFTPAEIEKERRVITEEISDTFDDPSELLFYDMDGLMWPEHRLGSDIAGTVESIAGLTRPQMLDFVARHYGPENMVVGVAGLVRADEIIPMIAEAFAGMPPGARGQFIPFVNRQSAARLKVRYRDMEQAQLAVSVWGLPRGHPDRFVLRVLNAILGGGMSSRLFQEIREKRGLAYEVSSYSGSLYDCGNLGASAAIDPRQAVPTLSAIMGEWDRLRQEPVSDEEITLAKEYLKGGLLLSMESTSSIAGWYARQEVLEQPMLTVDGVVELIEMVTAADVQRLAQELFRQDALNLAVVGPFRSENKFAKALKL